MMGHWDMKTDTYTCQPTPKTEYPPELVERMVAYLRKIDHHIEARAILAELEPVDPLLDALNDALGCGLDYDNGDAEDLRSELAKRGGRIVFDGKPS